MSYLLVKLRSGIVQGLRGIYANICDGCSPDKVIMDLNKYPTYERIDKYIDFVWFDDPISGVDLRRFVAKWEGFLVVRKPGIYRFFMEADIGGRLYIDGRLVIDAWDKTLQKVWSDRIEFKAGVYRIDIHYYNTTPFGKISVGWQRNDEVAAIIPPENLFTLTGSSVIITNVHKSYRIILVAEPIIKEAVFKGGIAFIPIGMRKEPLSGYIYVYDHKNNMIYRSPYIEDIWPGDIYSLEYQVNDIYNVSSIYFNYVSADS